MIMPTMTISLHDQMKKHISNQGTSAGAYIRMLILQDMISTVPADQKARLEAACMYMARTDIEKTKIAFSDLFHESVKVQPAISEISVEKEDAENEEPEGPSKEEVKKKKDRPVLPSVF